MDGDDKIKKGKVIPAEDAVSVASSTRIYPIPASLSAQAIKADVQIVKLEAHGFMAYVRTGVLHVGVHYMCEINLPFGQGLLQTPGQVFKTYDHVNPNKGQVNRVAEVLFTKISETDKARIRGAIKAGTPKT